jgi:PAS domain S-box-containing protein
MNINPAESTMELTKLSPPEIIFGTEVDEKSSSEQFLLSMYDSVQASIFVVDVLEDGDFQYVALNPTHERWIGIRSDELRGKKPEDILSPIDAIRVRQHYADCVLFGKTISYEQCLQFQGVPTWWSTTLTPLRDANSRIYRLIGTSSNITSVKQAQEAGGLQVERERLLEAIAGRIHQSVELETILHQTTIELQQFLNCDRILIYRFQADGSGLIVAESSVAASDSLLGKNIIDPGFSGNPEHYGQGCIQVIEDIYAAGLHPYHIDFLASLQIRANVVVPIFQEQDMWGLLIAHHCQESRQWQQAETDLLKQLATQIGIAVQQAELRQQLNDLKAKTKLQKQKHKNQLQQVANECAIAIRQAQLYQQTQTQVKELENCDRLKNQFLRNLSQELRTPITSISLAVQTLESVLTPAEILEIEIVPQLLQILHKECARESKLINDLLTLTYLEAEPKPPTLIAIDLQSWLHPIVESFRDLTNCQRQELKLSVDHTLPLLETDITDMERIITELLNHVCKYTPASETITVSAHLRGDAIELNISNSGLELTSNELSLIFEPFYHLSKHDPWKHSGTGLELALVQKMVRHLGGSLDVKSGAGQTTFTIKFPI